MIFFVKCIPLYIILFYGVPLDFDQNFLKTLTVLYAEDDAHARNTLVNILEKLVKKVYVAENGRQGFEYFKKFQDSIDIIVSDINMPHISGLEFLELVREKDDKIPFIFTTAHQENEFLLAALKFGVTHYAKKPVNIKELMLEVQSACLAQYQYAKTLHAQKEAQGYLSVLNQVAIVSKTDLIGEITYVNDTFCDISGYERDELIGQSHSIIAHRDTPNETYQDMWATLRAKEKWQGKIKNKNKDGEAYFVNANIFPVFDQFDLHVVEYMSIQFLTTAEENEKREYKAHIRQLTLESKKTEGELKAQIENLQKKINSAEYIEVLEETASKSSKHNKDLLKQTDYYEDKIKQMHQEKLEIQKKAKEHFFSINDEYKSLQNKLRRKEKTVQELEERVERQNQEIRNLLVQIEGHDKIVFDLKDVIDHVESQLASCQKKLKKR